ncbi:DDHD-domain-containing protein [Parathielavia appendiculata]|uniref:DDHD-domain-containing protein n=1 Tax=Parathielavia appendiculata TaxID=2587402 RepID=A0AAN6U6G5_9PEZI|nr:DDHD-domain-containing protein [Parathielavia appendiculata]
MAPGSAEKKAEKSYFASAVDSINPWAANRSTTPTPRDPQPPVPPSHPNDHTTNPYYGQSFRRYPPDCPPLNVQWFHAADVPKRKPRFLLSKNGRNIKPLQPKKFVPFSVEDSRAIEIAYQTKLEDLEEERGQNRSDAALRAGLKRPRGTSPDASLNADSQPSKTMVPVNEDFLFDVNIEDRELAPVYWEGPVYEVRRGSWFYQEGSALRPCEENLAAQLEEGYLKIKPWQYPARSRSNSSSKPVAPKASGDNQQAAADAQDDASKKAPLAPQHQPQTYRLFGGYMNSVVTYEDSSTAWLSSEGMLSWVTSTVYERFAGGGYMGGVKLVRGYSEPNKVKEDKRPSTPTGTESSSKERGDKLSKPLKRRSAPPSGTGSDAGNIKQEAPNALESTRNRLTRQLSNLMEGVEDPDREEEAIRKQEEKEIAGDYNARVDENQGRDIEHLVLVTHGIGQLLSRRMESINFVHDVNVLRKTMKSVYSASADLRALNSEINEPGPGNSRVQVLPVCWRHLLDFPKRKPKRGERDLGEAVDEEGDYPSLEDITVEGVAFARSLISDLALDVLLYQSAYREQIVEIVLRESNRIYNIFKKRNPNFNGKVHIVGHSLGSAIMFDILCRQKEMSRVTEPPRNPLRIWPKSEDRYESREPKELAFDFEVDDFFCLGSPIGLFQMLKGRTIAARTLSHAIPSESPLNPDYMDDPFLDAPTQSYSTHQRVSPVTGLPFSVSSPKVGQLFNIFHPSDPISYRLEPLISPVMSTLKPQALPYTKKGIFGSVAPQGLTGIGAKVGQSVSGLWSSLSAGIASNLLNRSLGLSNEDVAKITASHQEQQQQQQGHVLSPGAGTNVSAGVIPAEGSKVLMDAERSERTAERMRQLASGREGGNGKEATLIDDELETLYSRFQKNRVAIAASSSSSKEMDTDGEKDAPNSGKERGTATTLSREQWLEEERKAQRLRREEMKIRALNQNGRVDYCIQESVLDYNPLNTIASHMSYWADEDVNHFMLSQMLASKDRTPKG